MQQISLYLSGQRNYSLLTGSTGPLVYPAAHVHIYHVLYKLTSHGSNILVAQILFLVLYLGSLSLVMACYRTATSTTTTTTTTTTTRCPPWVIFLLSASKRVHSIFVLRLFNDAVAVCWFWGAVWCLQRRRWRRWGSVVFAVGVGVKMSVLLALPAVGVVLWWALGRNGALWEGVVMGQVQTILAYPFIMGGFKSYMTRAFEFTRQFMFKWTVNWRFIGEETFLSRSFSYCLLGAHVALLALFGCTRWLEPSGLSPLQAIHHLLHPPPQAQQDRIARRVTPDFVLTTMLSAMLIGCLCARSLHYQFFVYIAWSTPYLLWRSGMHPILVYGLCMAQEWAWNVYPSTDASSMVVVGCLAVTVASIWIGTSPQPAKQQQQRRSE